MWLCPEAQLWFAVFFSHANSNETLSHSHIPYAQPKKLIISRIEIQKRKNLEQTIRRYLKLSGQGWANGKRRIRRKKKELRKTLSSCNAQDIMPGPFKYMLPHLVLDTIP